MVEIPNQVTLIKSSQFLTDLMNCSWAAYILFLLPGNKGVCPGSASAGLYPNSHLNSLSRVLPGLNPEINNISIFLFSCPFRCGASLLCLPVCQAWLTQCLDLVHIRPGDMWKMVFSTFGYYWYIVMTYKFSSAFLVKIHLYMKKRQLWIHLFALPRLHSRAEQRKNGPILCHLNPAQLFVVTINGKWLCVGSGSCPVSTYQKQTQIIPSGMDHVTK